MNPHERVAKTKYYPLYSVIIVGIVSKKNLNTIILSLEKYSVNVDESYKYPSLGTHRLETRLRY